MDRDLRASLRESYGRKARERDLAATQPWKAEERKRFLDLLRSEGARTLLELGAGPGKDAEFFRGHGLRVLCTDLSPEMVALCRSKGLAARVMDLANIDLQPESFDAVYALNCLLHLPARELPVALGGIRAVLKPGGLFYLGLYGGKDHEGVREGDPYEPKRFFSFHTDERLREIVAGQGGFDVYSYRRIELAAAQTDEMHFQSLILRRRV